MKGLTYEAYLVDSFLYVCEFFFAVLVYGEAHLLIKKKLLFFFLAFRFSFISCFRSSTVGVHLRSSVLDVCLSVP